MRTLTMTRTSKPYVALYGCRSGMGLIFPNQDVVAPLLTYVSDPCSLKPSLARFESFCEYARILATWRGSARGVASAHVDIGCVAQRSNPTMDRTMGSRIRFSPLSGLRVRSGFASSLSFLLPPLSSLLLSPPSSHLSPPSSFLLPPLLSLLLLLLLLPLLLLLLLLFLYIELRNFCFLV